MATGWTSDSRLEIQAVALTPDDSEGVGINMIAEDVWFVDAQAPVNGVNDFLVLPSLANIAIGHRITIICMSGGAFELRTPASSSEEINSANADGTLEYTTTDGNILYATKIDDTIGWTVNELTPLGAVVAATVPQ